MKKYELTTEVKVEFGITLHRIRALVDIARYGVKAGDLGGWIEKEANLDQEGDAWVFDDARVFGDAWVYGEALVYGEARVSGEARVFGEARVYGDAWVYGEARLSDNAWVSGEARVFGDAWVYGEAWVSGEARVYGEARLSDNAWVYGEARVYGDARVFGDAWVYGEAWVSGEAQLSKAVHVLTVGPIGSRNGTTTFFRARVSDGFAISVCCGCFLGTVDEFRAKVKQTHGDSKHGKVYQLAADLAEAQIELDGEVQ